MGFTREQQDDYAVTSFKRAIAAAGEKRFAEEIEPIQVKAGRETITVSGRRIPEEIQRGKAAQAPPRLRGERHRHCWQCFEHQ